MAQLCPYNVQLVTEFRVCGIKHSLTQPLPSRRLLCQLYYRVDRESIHILTLELRTAAGQ